MSANRRTVRIEWGDCDPAGIVYFPRYLEIFDACTSAAFEAAGLPKPKLLQTFGIAGIPVVDIHASFNAPCTFGDEVVIETSLSDWARSSFKVHHRLQKEELVAAEAVEVRVWTIHDPAARSGLRSAPVPPEVIARFSRSPS